MAKMLKSSFSFGFELEGIAASDVSNLENSFNEFLGNNGDMHRDGSLRPGRERGGIPFEYSSPVFQYIPTNISKVINFLDNLKNWDVYTNRSCGFHTHISFNGITKKDVMWFMLYLCGTGKIHDFDKLGRSLLYNNTYASPRFIERTIAALKDNDLSSAIVMVATNEKYRSIRLHPQGTVEWRGPRTFLNIPTHKKTKSFFEKLDKMINYFVESVNIKSFDIKGYGDNVYTVTKDIFNEQCLSCPNYFSTMFKSNNNGNKTLTNVCSSTPEILEKIPYKSLVKCKDQILDIIRNNSSVTYYKKYKSKALLKFTIENFDVDLIDKLCSMFDTDAVIQNADLVYAKGKLCDYFFRNISDNTEFIKYMIDFANKGLYINTLKKLVTYIKQRASGAYFVSFLACLMDGDFMKIYDDDEKTKNELIDDVICCMKSSSSPYFFNSFSPAYISLFMAKNIFRKNGIKL